MHCEHAPHRAEIELAMEMRKQLVVARALPAQGIAERARVDLDQEQAGLAEIVLSRGVFDLGGGREMNEAVAGVIGASAIDALPFGLAPGRGRADFVNHGHVGGSAKCLSMFPKSPVRAAGSPDN